MVYVFVTASIPVDGAPRDLNVAKSLEEGIEEKFHAIEAGKGATIRGGIFRGGEGSQLLSGLEAKEYLGASLRQYRSSKCTDDITSTRTKQRRYLIN